MEKSRADKWLEKNISIVTRAANLGDYEMPEGYTLPESKWIMPAMIGAQIGAMFLAGKIRSWRDERVQEEADFEKRMREKYSNYKDAEIIE